MSLAFFFSTTENQLYRPLCITLVRSLLVPFVLTRAALEHGQGLLPGDVEGDGQVRRGLPAVPVADLDPYVRADPSPQVRKPTRY